MIPVLIRLPFQDWYDTVDPEADSLGYYYSSLPTILFQMVEDQVSIL